MGHDIIALLGVAKATLTLTNTLKWKNVKICQRIVCKSTCGTAIHFCSLQITAMIFVFHPKVFFSSSENVVQTKKMTRNIHVKKLGNVKIFSLGFFHSFRHLHSWIEFVNIEIVLGFTTNRKGSFLSDNVNIIIDNKYFYNKLAYIC